MKETFCRIRAVHQAIAEFERTLQQLHGVSLNEAMLLCSLAAKSPLSAAVSLKSISYLVFSD